MFGENHSGQILHLLMIVRECFEQLHILGGKRNFQAVDDIIIAIIATFTADIHCTKAIQSIYTVCLTRESIVINPPIFPQQHWI